MRGDDSSSSDVLLSKEQEPDWETFEQVETYANGDEEGLLRFLLPTRVWDYIFAPTEAGRDSVLRQRDQISEVYLSAIEVYARAAIRLDKKVHSGLEVDERDFLAKVLEEVEQHHFPASTPSFDQNGSLSRYIDSVDQAISSEEEALESIRQLLSEPAAAYLRESERTELSDAEQFLCYSVNQGAARRERIEKKRKELISSLQNRVEALEQKLTRVEERSEPYLTLDQYLSEDDLLDDAESIRVEIARIRESSSFDVLSHPLIQRFGELERDTLLLIEHLEQSRTEYATARFAEFRPDTQQSLAEIQRRLRSSREEGTPIEDSEAAENQIIELRDRIERFRNEPFASELPDSQSSELAGYVSTLDTLEAFVNEKARFDSKIEEVSQRLDNLRTDAQPYLDYSRYLTRPVASELSEQIAALQTELKTIREQTQFALLSDNDRNQLDKITERRLTIDSHLTDYNKEFVQRQRKKCKSIFTDIGPSQFDLTPEQERAVVRNGIYNQVVAAAGTGKTLALTTRVAYLVDEQDLDPGRILVVTYTNEATNEMRTRLEEHFGITDVEVQTVHAFGRGIIQDAANEYVDSVDSGQIDNFVDRQIRRAREDGNETFLSHYYEFLVHFDDVYYEEEDFETKKEYIQARAEQQYTTLKGEEVKSRAEKLIADFLFTHRVAYRYEDIATWADSSSERKEYAPDFYLPEYDAYIEHWGIDETASVAPWFSWSADEYHEKMRWARGEFEESDYTLVETYEFEQTARRLEKALTHRLSEIGVELDRMGFEELVNSAFDYEQREGWIKSQFTSFIENAKLFDVKPDEIEMNLSEANPRQCHFGYCGIHMLQQYTRFLLENDIIDYADMIHDAVHLIQQNSRAYRDRYDHILVDEFQDIGKGKLELVQALTGPEGAKLFAVGDDWQSIFSFQGAVTQYFTAFEEYFGDPVRTDLTRNFRSPHPVVAAGNHLIEHNENQLAKEVRSEVDYDANPRIHSLRGYNFYDYVRRVRRYTLDLIQQYLSSGTSSSEIMVLCRFDGAVSYLDEIKNGLRSQEIPYVGNSDRYRGPNSRADDGVSVYTPYQAKGREAKHVIVVHVAEGPYGFPPDSRDNELIEPVQPIPLGGIEEERRVFYVALTRTEHTVDFLTRANKESQFLDEISDFTVEVDAGQVEPLDDVGEHMSVIVKVDKLQDPWRKQHQRGFLADQYGGSARFVSWESSNPPTLEEDEWYELTDVRVGEYKDEKELVITQQSTITPLRNSPEVPDVVGRR